MSDLVAFLRARLVAERAVAERIAARLVYPPDRELAGQSYWPMPTVRRAAERSDEDAATLIGAFSPARVLAEVDAKRRIVDEYVETIRIRDEVASRIRAAGENPDEDDLDTWCRAQTEAAIMFHALRHLAAPYAAHPDCWDGWKP